MGNSTHSSSLPFCLLVGAYEVQTCTRAPKFPTRRIFANNEAGSAALSCTQIIIIYETMTTQVPKRVVTTIHRTTRTVAPSSSSSSHGVIRASHGATNNSTNEEFLIEILNSVLKIPLWIRISVFEIWIIGGLFLLTIGCHTALSYHERILHPYIQAQKWTNLREELEETYYRFECSAKDISANVASDVFFNEKEHSPEQAIDKALLHGAVVLPNLLSPKKCSDLRRHVMKRLRLLDESTMIDVIMPENRYSFALSATEHSSVSNAFQELGSHKILEQVLQKLVPGAAIVEQQIIVSIAPSPTQFWHADSEPERSAMRFGQSFSPIYTLLIPLQDTTPGTIRCMSTGDRSATGLTCFYIFLPSC